MGVKADKLMDRLNAHPRRNVHVRTITDLKDEIFAENQRKKGRTDVRGEYKLFELGKYAFWQSKDGYYGVVEKDSGKRPNCGYKYLWSLMRLKGI